MTNQISVITPTTRYRRAKKPAPEWFCSDSRQTTASDGGRCGKPLPPSRQAAALTIARNHEDLGEQSIEEPSCH
jgi:hypothetical protein